jgi:hypothetical protein
MALIKGGLAGHGAVDGYLGKFSQFPEFFSSLRE